MEHIIRVGQNEFIVSYQQKSFDSYPVIWGIVALKDAILFEGSMPILFPKNDVIQLSEAANLTPEVEGKVTLERRLVEEIKALPKSSVAVKVGS